MQMIADSIGRVDFEEFGCDDSNMTSAKRAGAGPATVSVVAATLSIAALSCVETRHEEGLTKDSGSNDVVCDQVEAVRESSITFLTVPQLLAQEPFRRTVTLDQRVDEEFIVEFGENLWFARMQLASIDEHVFELIGGAELMRLEESTDYLDLIAERRRVIAEFCATVVGTINKRR